MCRKADTTTTNMVTPTKVKVHQRSGGKQWTPNLTPKKGTISPQPTISSGSSTPSNRESPCFAGSKCFEPPTPDSLPKPPMSWTPNKPPKPYKAICTTDEEEANRTLRMLLKVQA